jgi:hypothetical protein
MAFRQLRTRLLITRYRIEVKDGRPHMVLVVLEDGAWRVLEGTAEDVGAACPPKEGPGRSAA